MLGQMRSKRIALGLSAEGGIQDGTLPLLGMVDSGFTEGGVGTLCHFGAIERSARFRIGPFMQGNVGQLFSGGIGGHHRPA